MRYPTDNPKTTQVFGNDIINGKPYYSKNFWMKWHDGWDIRARTPQPIYAVCNGTITVHSVNEWRPYGNFIDLVGNGYLFRYAHLSEMSVKSGQIVKEWDKIGMTGNTWKSGWPHLHFGCYQVDNKWSIVFKWNGYFGAIDPIPVLNQITMWQFKAVLDKEFPEFSNLFSDYSDTSPVTAGDVKAISAIAVARAKKQNLL